MMRHGQTTPYTEIGVKRLSCVRCGKPAHAQWNACADGPYRPICKACDIQLNLIVLRFMRDPDWKRKITVYKESVDKGESSE